MLVYILSFFLIFSSVASLQADEMSKINFIEKGICKVLSKSGQSTSSGTGWFYIEHADKYVIMTNGHVIDGGRSFGIKVFQDGNKTKEIPAHFADKYYTPNTDMDFGFLYVYKSDLGGYEPSILSLEEKVNLSPGDKIFGWGCPDGRDSFFWRSIVKSDNGRVIEMINAPAGGQSGGPVLVDGNPPKVVGLVTWRYDDRDTGGIISVNNFWSIQNKTATTQKIVRKHTRLKEASKQTCDLCVHSKDDHYFAVINGKPQEGLYCPTTLGVSVQSCGPQGCPPNINYGGRQYYRYREFGSYYQYDQRPTLPPNKQPNPIVPPNTSPKTPDNPSDIWIGKGKEEPKAESKPAPNTELEDLKNEKLSLEIKIAALEKEVKDSSSKIHSLTVEKTNVEKTVKEKETSILSLQKDNSVLRNGLTELKEKIKGMVAKPEHFLTPIFGDKTDNVMLLIYGGMMLASGASIPAVLARMGAKRLIGRFTGIIKKRKSYRQVNDNGHTYMEEINDYVYDRGVLGDSLKK